MDIPFPKGNFRARCLNVVDGDTVDLEVDVGFHIRTVARFRLLGIDTYELRSKLPEERVLAKQAKELVIQWLKPSPQPTEWNLIISVQKDPDNFGRYLTNIGTEIDGKPYQDVGQTLLEMKLAVPYKE